MGYYIEVPHNHDKAEQIVELHGGEIIRCPESFADVPTGKALICVVDNLRFEAAGFCFDSQEFSEFSRYDGRPKKWVLIDYDKAKELTGFNA
jgi:hypothetical protein